MNCFILSCESCVCFVSASLRLRRKRQDMFRWARSIAYRSEDSGNVLGRIRAELGE